MRDTTTLEALIKEAFNAAHELYEFGHLHGDQIKNHLRLAMSHLNVDEAMILAGKTNHNPKGAMKAKAFPVEKLDVPENPNFPDATTVAVPVVVVDEGSDGDGLQGIVAESEGDMFDEIVKMSPKKAVEKYGSLAIREMATVFQIEITEESSDAAAAAAVIQFLKAEAKRQNENSKRPD